MEEIVRGGGSARRRWCVEEAVLRGSRLVGEGKLIREGRASASRRQAGAIKEGSRFLPSRRVLSRAITACAINAGLSRRVRNLAIKAGIVAMILGRIVKGYAGFPKAH